MDELKNSGHKFTEEDVVMIARQKNWKLLWLEKGIKTKVLEHIIEKHSNDFKNKFGIPK